MENANGTQGSHDGTPEASITNPSAAVSKPVPRATVNPALLPLGSQLEQLRPILATNTTLLRVLDLAAQLRLPDWYLAGGAVSQTIWNFMSGHAPEAGIRDYDLVYYDASDLSWEAEDAVIKRAQRAFEAAGVAAEVEIRNQARVHLWYGAKFGVECAPHGSVEAAIDSWISTSAMIGVRPARRDGHACGADDGWDVYAPRGLSDFFNLVVRPNPVLGKREQYMSKVVRWQQHWDNLVIEPWPSS
ncbi:amine oxidase [Purpureocillium lavendulum]|uniref:Amine oxidase n=1 Tax=Purpureocillium lavendulum TaxID=1247861 RepID=A0AB34FF08_9HYPO|nr:amine oxidase [Purpureocillium lavendulum]